jgi:hypothetical protein
VRPSILIAAFLALALPASAALYKWVDEKGVTHYSESPPPEGTQAKKLELPSTAPNEPGKARPDTPEEWKGREIEFRRRMLEKQKAEESAKAQGERSEGQRKQRCTEARRRLDLLSAGRPLYHVNEKGERVYMEESDRAAETAKWRKEIDQSCDS